MKKIIFLFVAIVLLAAMLVVPVSAADSGWQSISVRFDNNLYISESSNGLYYNYFYAGKNTGDHYAYQLDKGVENITAASRLTGAEFSLSQGDVVVIPDINASFTGWLGGTNNRITDYRWAVCYFDDSNNAKVPYTCFMATGWRDFKGRLYGEGYTSSDTYIKGDTNWGISSLQGTTLTAPKSYTRCSVLLLLRFEMVTDATFSMNNRDFTISFGNANSPYAPKFNPVDDTQLNNYEIAEEALLDVLAPGSDMFAEVLGNADTGISSYVAGFAAVNQIWDVVWDEFDFIRPLVTVSLSIGLAGFILNLGFVVLNKYRSQAESAARESRLKSRKKDGD